MNKSEINNNGLYSPAQTLRGNCKSLNLKSKINST